MDELAFIQAAQTGAIVVVVLVITYALVLARTAFVQMRAELKEIRGGLTQVREAFRSQKDIEDAIERIWKRIDEIETLQGMRIDFDELTRFKRLIDGLEAAAKRTPKPDDTPVK